MTHQILSRNLSRICRKTLFRACLLNFSALDTNKNIVSLPSCHGY